MEKPVIRRSWRIQGEELTGVGRRAVRSGGERSVKGQLCLYEERRKGEVLAYVLL